MAVQIKFIDNSEESSKGIRDLANELKQLKNPLSRAEIASKKAGLTIERLGRSSQKASRSVDKLSARSMGKLATKTDRATNSIKKQTMALKKNAKAQVAGIGGGGRGGKVRERAGGALSGLGGLGGDIGGAAGGIGEAISGSVVAGFAAIGASAIAVSKQLMDIDRAAKEFAFNIRQSTSETLRGAKQGRGERDISARSATLRTRALADTLDVAQELRFHFDPNRRGSLASIAMGMGESMQSIGQVVTNIAKEFPNDRRSFDRVAQLITAAVGAGVDINTAFDEAVKLRKAGGAARFDADKRVIAGALGLKPEDLRGFGTQIRPQTTIGESRKLSSAFGTEQFKGVFERGIDPVALGRVKNPVMAALQDLQNSVQNEIDAKLEVLNNMSKIAEILSPFETYQLRREIEAGHGAMQPLNEQLNTEVMKTLGGGM